jgi:hypothetical protein
VPSPSVLVIALATNELSSPRTAAMLSSAHQVLGERVSVRVEVIETKDQAEALLNSRPTSAYAWLSWDNTDTRVAHLRCFIPTGNRWVQRDVTFAPQDPEVESGRTLGFVIASIYVEGSEPQNKPLAPVPLKTSEMKPSAEVKSSAPDRSRFQLGAAASFAAPRDMTSLGAWFGIQLTLSRSFWLGAAGDIRFGTIGKAQASERFIAGGLVGTYRAWPRTGPFWCGPQVFLGAEQVALSHFSEDDPKPVNESAWTARLDLLATGNWELSGTSMLFVGLGTNYRFGETDVYVHGTTRAHLPAWAAIGRLGVAARF